MFRNQSGFTVHETTRIAGHAAEYKPVGFTVEETARRAHTHLGYFPIVAVRIDVTTEYEYLTLNVIDDHLMTRPRRRTAVLLCVSR